MKQNAQNETSYVILLRILCCDHSALKNQLYEGGGLRLSGWSWCRLTWQDVSVAVDVSLVMSQRGGRRLRAALSLHSALCFTVRPEQAARDKTSGKICKEERVSCLMHVELLFLAKHGRVRQRREGDVQEKEEKEAEEVQRHRWDQHVQSGWLWLKF